MKDIGFFLCFLTLFGVVAAWSGNSKQLCSRVRVKCVWERRCIYQTWMGCCAYGNFIVEIRYTEYFCCSGWRHNGNKVCNIPICRGECGGPVRGTCVAPDVCDCNSGYDGTYCSDIAECSHLSPCYPGYCTGTGSSSSCQCTNSFYPRVSTGRQNCLNYPVGNIYEPIIEQSTVKLGYYHQVKKMIMYNMTIDSAMSPGNVETFWMNRREFNRMSFTFQSIYSSDVLDLPVRPSYVHQFVLGVTEADIFVNLKNLNSESKFNTTLRCSGISRDSPAHENLFRCDESIANFDKRFDSGDTYEVTYRARNGGFRVLSDETKQYYQGLDARKVIRIKFDTETPYHCSEKNECIDPTYTMMHITNDVTKTDIEIRWKGWKDQLSKVARYALEVFKLQPDGEGNLKEPYTDLVPNPVPLTITEFLETTEGAEHTFSYRPKEPGVYSWILEANDKANNSAYTRRFVIYDPVSTVTSDPSHRFYATSGNPKSDYNWQIQNPQAVSLTWKNHFVNTVHENGQFLNRIRLFRDALSDGGSRNFYKTIPDKYDDVEGKRSRDAIPNERGIIKYDVAYYFGRDQLTPPSYQFQNLSQTSIDITLNQLLQNGSSVSVWLKAYDILGNTKVERILVHYDSSPPSAYNPTLQRNVAENTMDFTSRLEILGATDPDSGVNRIKYRFFAQSTGDLINGAEYEYENPMRDANYCSRFPCDENLPNGASFGRTIQLDFDNCHAMNVSNVATETVMMQLDIYNSAGLFIQKSVEINNLTTLRGVNDYFGPMKVTIAEVISPTSIKIMWEQAPSCYNIQGINFTYTRADGTDEKAFLVHKNNPWFTMSNLKPGAKYIIRLYTLYGDDENNPIRSDVTVFTTNIPQRLEGEESDPGAIVGGVVGSILIIIILLLLFLLFMVKTRRMRNPMDRFRSQKPTSYIDNEFEPIGGKKRLNNSSIPKAYGNRAYSQEFDDDVYYAENETPLKYQIVRHRITFEEEIARGKFAIIYKAKYVKDSSTTVVAKTLKENPTQTDIETMHAKVNFYTMKVGEHPNILKFIGVVDDNVLGRFMILEYCENGTLKEYLKRNKHKVNDEMHEKLYRFACGICKGMNYLASQGVVHRRLAARNVLLTFLLETKITGFGPEPRDSDGDDKNERIPIKWMAPECTKTTKHATEKSDVWSYGVVLWEIFSMGEAPYEGIKSVELDSRLKRGERLKKPEHCDDTFYKIMKKCWLYDGEERPNFEEIMDQLQTLFTGNIDGDDYYYSQQGLYDNRK